MSKASSTNIKFPNRDSNSGCVRRGLAKAAIVGQHKSRFVNNFIDRLSILLWSTLVF